MVALRWAVESSRFQALLADTLWELLDVSSSWDELRETGTGEETPFMTFLVTNFAIGLGLVNLPASILCLV